jgi:hypothetical protein
MLYAMGLLAAGIVFVAGSVFVRHMIEYGQGTIQLRFLDWLSDLKTVEGLLREIGFALLIAFLVTIAVEMYLRNLQVRERKIEDQNLKQDVLAAIFGITEPRQVVDKVLRLILQEKFYRKGHRMECFLERISIKDLADRDVTAMRLTVYDEYVVKNNSHHDEVFSFSYHIEAEDSYFRSIVAHKEFEIRNLQFFRLPSKQRVTSIVDAPKIYNSNEPKSQRLTCQIAMASDEEVLVTVESVSLKRQEDDEIFFSIYPTEGMTIEFQHPKDLHVKVLALADVKANCLRQCEEGRPGQWKVDGVLLPYNGIQLKWH